jgi:small-conductance mechanosensitive channel
MKRPCETANLSEIIREILQTNQFASEIIASAIIIASIAVIGWLAYYIFGKYLASWARKTKTTLDDAILPNIKQITIVLIILFGFYGALTSLPSLAAYQAQVLAIFNVTGILLGAFAIARFTSTILNWYAARNEKDAQSKNSHLLFILNKVVQFIVYLAALFVILWILGIDLSAVVVGLGVGSIAIAFALQSTLGDVFSAFSIYFDRPFQIGDFIVVGEYTGTVTNIGVKSTRLKLLHGEELVIPNKELTSTAVRNFRKLEKRRVQFNVGVTYGTPSAKLKKIPGIVTEILQKIDLATLDHVFFTEFGVYSLIFTIVYYVKSANYIKYKEVQQTINFAIKEEFEKEGIEIAFPTQTVYLNK